MKGFVALPIAGTASGRAYIRISEILWITNTEDEKRTVVSTPTRDFTIYGNDAWVINKIEDALFVQDMRLGRPPLPPGYRSFDDLPDEEEEKDE